MVSSPSTNPGAARQIRPTLDELRLLAYDSRNIQAALEALYQDGFAVLKSVDVPHVDHLHSYMAKEAEELLKNDLKAFNQGVNSKILQAPPLKNPDYLYDDIFFNPFVIQLMNMYLGTRPIWSFLIGNNALPRTNGLRQPVRKDTTFLHPQCPFFVIANIPLCDFNPTKGSTEFWLGSHAHTSGADQAVATPETRLANATLRVGEPTTNVLPHKLKRDD